MNIIRFYDIQSTKKELSFTVKEIKLEEAEDRIFFKYDLDEAPTNIQIAAVICTLVGANYNRIEIELELPREIINKMKAFTKAEIICKESGGVVETHTVRSADNENILLNFSGGFDSLAMLELLPKSKTRLVSVNFNGWFRREADFFQQFPTDIVETNIRRNSMNTKIDLACNDWRFMGVASILFGKKYNAKYHTFGSVFDSTSNYISNRKKLNSLRDPVFYEMGDLLEFPPAKGFTQVGSIMLVSHYCPGYISPSLNSVADKGSDKRRMKELFLKSIDSSFDIRIPKIEETECTRKGVFGEKYDYDFMTLYILKRLGRKYAEEVIEKIPKEAEELCNRLKMDFYERLNTNYLYQLPKWYLGDYFSKLSEAGIIPYSEDDFEELAEVYRFLVNYEEDYRNGNN